MKQKGLFFFMVFLAFGSISTFAQVQVSRDYLGTWSGVDETGEEGSFIIRTTTMSIVNGGQQITVEIIGWLTITNEDQATRHTYPTGALVTIRNTNGGTGSMQIFLHQDKQKIIFPLFYSTISDAAKYPFSKH